MSEAEEPRAGRDEIWIEKYRPETLDDIVGQDTITERLESYVERNDLPHLMFSGEAGIGKCVTGETPVLTTDGLARIEAIVGDREGFGSPADDLEVLTLTETGEFEFTSPSHTFGKRTDELVSVETRDGSSMQVTPEHKLLVLGESGLEWTAAADIDAGDRIVRPLRAPLPETDERVDWVTAMDGDRTFVHVSEGFATRHSIPAEQAYVGKKRAVVRRLRNGKDVDAIAEATSLPPSIVAQYRDEVTDTDLSEPSTVCSLSHLRELDTSRAELQEHVEQIQWRAENGRAARPITPPWSVTPRLARFLGLAISEARLDGGRIKFYNDDDGLREQFETAARGEFAVELQYGEQNSTPHIEIGSRTLTHYLESCFDVFASATGSEDGEIGSRLLRATDESRAAFLQAVFDAEGHVTEGGIVELTQKNGDLITLLSYLLTAFGIPNRRTTDRKAATNGTGVEREYHTLFVSGSANLSTFAERIGFTMDTKRARLHQNADRDGNPNHDTIPVQDAVAEVCEALTLPKGDLLTGTLNPKTPGRENYLDDVGDVLNAAAAKLETAQSVRQEVQTLRSDVEQVESIPATWVAERPALAPIAERADLENATGIRKDRLLEYADGRRTPTARRAERLLAERGRLSKVPDINHIQTTLQTAIERLGVRYSDIASDTHLDGRDVRELLENNDHDLGSLSRFGTVADRIEAVADEMLSMDVLERISRLQVLTTADLYYDEVESAERVEESRRVYDLTVPESRNYVAGQVPTVMHNTTAAQAVTREFYGEDWREHFLELNASDQRGIDVVRERIKSFARSSFSGQKHRIIFLDEADSLCVPPGTEVVAGSPSSPEVKPIEEVAEDGEPVPSVDFETNEIQSDTGRLVDSGVADFFEVELADGRTITASLSHPFFVVGEDGQLVEKELQELEPGDEIADFRDDVGVSQCDVCGDWTAGRFCSLDCKNEGHSREMQGEGNPMHGVEWSEERREKIVEKLSDGRFAGENNPNYGGEFHGVRVCEVDEETVEEYRDRLSEMRSDTPWEEWVEDADPEAVKTEIADTMSEWWVSLDEKRRAELVEKSTENCDYPVCDITGDNNPMRDPEVAQKVSEALQGHEPTGGNIRHSNELGHLVRSDWEYEVGKALQEAGVEYEYEPEFELSDSVFHPDFLVDDTVIEVKGVAELWGQTERVEEFLETYGDEYTFVVVGDGELPHHEHYEREEFEPALVSDGGLRTVDTVEVRSIEYSHRGKAYNISMEGTPNFMLANGVLTHNTSDAQSALRRTMEQFSNNVRFILSCNYSSQIIDPIQSRCAVFRFAPLGEEAIAEQVRIIAEAEGIEVTDDGVEALIYAADGDMRKAINGLQAAAVTGEVVDEEGVYAITSTARPEDIREMVTQALDGDFLAARSTLDELLTDEGIAGGDVIDQLHRSVWEFDLDDEAAVTLLDRIGEADYRITEGANERIQLEALLASLALDD